MPLLATPLPHVMNSLAGPTAPKYTFLIFYASVVDGQMWCSDCRRVEPLLTEAFDGLDKPKAIIYWVGTKPEWKTPLNRARIDWKVDEVPTILRIVDGREEARIVNGEIDDPERLHLFIYPTES